MFYHVLLYFRAPADKEKNMHMAATKRNSFFRFFSLSKYFVGY